VREYTVHLDNSHDSYRLKNSSSSIAGGQKLIVSQIADNSEYERIWNVEKKKYDKGVPFTSYFALEIYHGSRNLAWEKTSVVSSMASGQKLIVNQITNDLVHERARNLEEKKENTKKFCLICIWMHHGGRNLVRRRWSAESR